MIRNTNKRPFLIVLLFAMFTFSSCKKNFLEELPPTSIPPEQALATEADLQAALRGAYAGFRGSDFFGRTVPVLGDLLADNSYVSLTNSGRYIVHNNYSYIAADGNTLGFWTSAYSVILRANNIINAQVASNANVDQYKGEAYAIRALCYFTLVRYFARPYTDNPNELGVPIVTSYDPNAKPDRAKISEVYSLINADLTKAYTLITQFTNSTQFSKFAAKALQAKMYLTMGDKTNAKTAALDVINNSGFSVVPAAGYVTFWGVLTPRTDKVETLFEVSSDANNNAGFDCIANIYNQAGYGDILCSDPLYNSMDVNDIRKSLYTVGLRGGLAAVNLNKKYPGTFGSEISDTKILRLSEMYLIAAEASLPGNETDALNYVNYISSRRTAPAIASTGTALFNDIIAERRKELAFEGDRYMDLQRLKQDVIRSANSPASALSLPYANFRRLLPIPQTELDANPNLRPQQNPNY